MERQRYTVTIVTPGSSAHARPTLLVPFDSSALVSAFVDELFRRVQKQGLTLQASTHSVTLHLDAEAGPVLDIEDLLCDLVTDPKKETVFAVFQPKTASSDPNAATATKQNNTHPLQTNGVPSHSPGPHISVRVITPELAKQDKSALTPIKISLQSTVKQLHQAVAEHLHLPHAFERAGLQNECNCNLARQLSQGASLPNKLIVVHGKSIVKHLDLPGYCIEANVTAAVNAAFGDGIAAKKITHHGEEYHDAHIGSTPRTYKRVPVIAICSKGRHVPAHAVVNYGSTEESQSRVLDLHTSEMPISPACMDLKISELGIDTLAVNGAIDLYAVDRNTSSSGPIAGHGKSAIFRYQAHWEPKVKQSDRGLAMFLSSLRVFASLVQDMDDDERLQDAIYYIFDLLSGFVPALRTLHVLGQGKTPTAVESAALSHAIFEVLAGFMPQEIIGTSRTRVFEGSRLLFGFILEKARSIKLTDDDSEDKALPYLTSFDILNIRDFKTSEGIMHLITTSQGVIEKTLFEAMGEGGVLRDSHLQSFLSDGESDPTIARAALLSGGMAAEVTVFSTQKLNSNDRYSSFGAAANVIETAELAELHHLAELCGRHKLTVHKPRELVSAVAPCLTFDRNGHVAVYTGQLPCSMPGKSSEVFRPKYGQETIDEAVVEQLLAPIIQEYESNGTAVFDLLGGAAVRRLQSPDEIVMFAVDCSSSMKSPTDFADVNEEDSVLTESPSVSSVIEGYHYNRLSFDEMKEQFSARESFDDMIAIVAGAMSSRRRFVASEVLELLRITIGAQIMKKHADLEARRSRMYRGYALASLESSLEKLKAFWAGLRTHETPLCDFLIFRASTSADINQNWTWSFGDEVPTGAQFRRLPALPDELIGVPNHLNCPISHALMEDAVKAADGFVYSRQAITQWFEIRPNAPTSPMTGLELDTTNIIAHEPTSNVVASWINGHDILAGQSPGSSTIKLTFESKDGSFTREVPTSLTVNDLHRLAFRGLKARFVVFQLAVGDKTLSPSNMAINMTALLNQKKVLIRLADDAGLATIAGASNDTVSGEMCLIKVYSGRLICSYWVRRDTTHTVESILWKFWRMGFKNNRLPAIKEQAVWTDLQSRGDGFLRGVCNSGTENLSTYLNRQHCFGKLSAEPVYKDDHNADDSVVTDAENNTPLVLKVDVDEPLHKTQKKRAGKLSRMDVLKQMFEALINRMLAYGYKSHVGLVTFDTTARVTMGITHVLENLRRATTSMRAEGDTALWDALALCSDQLKQYSLKYPNAKRRIIVISDGHDTKSTGNEPHNLAWKGRQDGIAIDSVMIGDDKNGQLMAVSHMLGCYKFHPTSLPNALAICEMEPFLSVTERPDIRPPGGFPPNSYSMLQRFSRAEYTASPTVVTADNFPVRKQHPNMGDDMVQLSAFPMQSQSARGGSATGSARSNLRTVRLLNEMRAIVTSGGHSSADIYISESDMSFWKVVIAGPEDSPYSEGNFLLYLHMEENYPTFAPQCRMITKIKHPNINPHGRVCHSLFGRDWTSDTSMRTVIDTIYGLLLQAEISDPVNTAAALGYHHDQVEYADEVRDYVQKHALKSREQWKDDLLGLAESHDD